MTYPRLPCLTAILSLASLFFASAPARADYPIASHRYLADPAAWVHDGRVYLYCSNDDDNVGDDSYEMASLVAVSSSDLKNWTDHGEVLRVPEDASWASFAWAPAVVERNGTFYMYFGNNANGVGVVTSTSPTGPFSDPRGSALVNSSTPGATGTNSWLFDPSVFVDDDDQAYLYFGGNGENNARVIRLNSDMISVSGSAMALSIQYFFEASWMHKHNGIYYFSYSTNPDNDLRIDYLTSSSPISGFTYRGTAAPQPPSNNNNNNHASIFEFNGVWYHAYHNRYVAEQTGDPPGYKRSIALERLDYNADGSIVPVTYTTDGLAQLGNLDPYTRVEAETFNAQSGIETEPCSEGGMDVTEIDDGDWVRLRGVDFGSLGAESFSARVASAASGGNIEIRLGEPMGTLVGNCAVSATGGAQTWTTSSCAVSGATGIADLYLRFTGSGSSLFTVNYWQFTPIAGGSGGAGGNGGAATGGSGGESGSGTTGGLGGAANSGGAASGGASTNGGAGAAVNLGGNAAGSAGRRDENSGASGGCGCRAAGDSSSGGWLGLVSLAAIALGRARGARHRNRAPHLAPFSRGRRCNCRSSRR
jgi:arabinoxylan arabinofuranohydrolase